MKVAAAKLSPLLKSDAQGLILAELFMNPNELFSISHLAEFAGTSLPTAMREVDRLLDGQLVIQKTSGRARFIQANKEHLLFESVSQIVAFSYGPAAVLPPLLFGLDGIEGGSWFDPFVDDVAAGAHEALAATEAQKVVVTLSAQSPAADSVAVLSAQTQPSRALAS